MRKISDNPEINQYLSQLDFQQITPEQWSRIGSGTLCSYLDIEPDLFRKYGEFIKPDVCAWSKILSNSPEYATQCDCWREFTTWHWADMLSKQKNLIAYVPDLRQINEYSWIYIISNQPELKSYCPYYIDPYMIAMDHPEVLDFISNRSEKIGGAV